jgi:hypothetical protein
MARTCQLCDELADVVARVQYETLTPAGVLQLGSLEPPATELAACVACLRKHGEPLAAAFKPARTPTLLEFTLEQMRKSESS